MMPMRARFRRGELRGGNLPTDLQEPALSAELRELREARFDVTPSGRNLWNQNAHSDLELPGGMPFDVAKATQHSGRIAPGGALLTELRRRVTDTTLALSKEACLVLEPAVCSEERR